MKNTFLYFIVFTMLACNSNNNSSDNKEVNNMKTEIKEIDVQGHRGCRGLLPENTLIAFEKALDLGVTTLEMDLVISQDKQVVVSHEPFFNHEISTAPDGQSISKEDQHDHNMYKLTYDKIKTYDVGSKPHEKFPDQANQKAAKPLFKDVVAMAEAHSKRTERPLPFYNVEIKRVADQDNLFHPGAIEFAELVVKEIQSTGIKERIYIQSFDIESLQESKKIDPEIKLVLLIMNTKSPQKNLEELGFTPEVYSPYYQLVNKNLVTLCKEKGIKLIPWTVNKEKDMLAMLEIGVDGIISDYPDKLLHQISKSALHTAM